MTADLHEPSPAAVMGNFEPDNGEPHMCAPTDETHKHEQVTGSNDPQQLHTMITIEEKETSAPGAAAGATVTFHPRCTIIPRGRGVSKVPNEEGDDDDDDGEQASEDDDGGGDRVGKVGAGHGTQTTTASNMTTAARARGDGSGPAQHHAPRDGQPITNGTAAVAAASKRSRSRSDESPAAARSPTHPGPGTTTQVNHGPTRDSVKGANGTARPKLGLKRYSLTLSRRPSDKDMLDPAFIPNPPKVISLALPAMLSSVSGSAQAQDRNGAAAGVRPQGNSLGVKHPDAVVVRSKPRRRRRSSGALEDDDDDDGSEQGSNTGGPSTIAGSDVAPNVDDRNSNHAATEGSGHNGGGAVEEDDDDDNAPPPVVLRSCLVLRDAAARRRWDRKEQEMQREQGEARERRRRQRSLERAAVSDGGGRTRRGSWSSSSTSAVGVPAELSTSPVAASGGLFRGLSSFRRSRSGSVGSGGGSDREEAASAARPPLSSPIAINGRRSASAHTATGQLSTSPTSDAESSEYFGNFGGLSLSPVASTTRRFGIVRRRSLPVGASALSVESTQSQPDGATQPERIIERVRHPGCIDEEDELEVGAEAAPDKSPSASVRYAFEPATVPLRSCCATCLAAVDKGLSPDWQSPFSASARKKLARQVSATQGAWTKSGETEIEKGDDHLDAKSIVAVDEIEMTPPSPAKKKYDDALCNPRWIPESTNSPPLVKTTAAEGGKGYFSSLLAFKMM